MQELLTSLPADELDGVVEQLLADDEPIDPVQNFAESRSARNAAVINAATARSQEIGPLPDPANPQRRERCANDNLLFAETYFSPTFYMPWAPYQREMMDAFQEVVVSGGKECHAVRRGGLKSTCARVSTLWATANGHRRFPVLVGATDDKANEHRENFFALLASSSLLVADYPELLPLLLKYRQPKRQFRLNGQLLAVHAKDMRGRIVFADVPGAASCEAHIAPYSVAATDVSGLSFVRSDGVTIRPDLLVFDDVQTPQSAKSPLMTDEREEAITKTFLGLAGLGEKIAAIMVATVREHNDLTERFISRERHPDWRGRKYPSLIKQPERMDLWNANAAKLGMGAAPAEGKQLATEHYIENREEMDRGGQVAWEHDKLPDEVSALQSLMTIRAIDPSFFRCEIQQEGFVPVNTSGVKLDAQTLLLRLSHVPRGFVPDQASYLTAFVDSSDQVLWWMVCAWTKDFSGWIVDYGTWPDQRRPTFYKSDLAATISQQLPGASWEEQFVHAHNELESYLLQDWPTQNGQARSVDLLLKDWSDGGQKPRIESQVMASQNRARLRPSKGFAPKPGRKPVHLWGDGQRDRHSGCGWVERRSENPVHVQYNVNEWKSHAARRLLTTVGAPSAVTLPGDDPQGHRLLAEHFTSEQPKSIVYDGAPGVAWELIVGRDNDWWDCYDDQTDVLTRSGWRRFRELTQQDELATVNLKTDAMEYQHSTHLIANRYSGPMIQIGGTALSHLDLCVTPNHRMVVLEGQRSRGPMIKLAKDLKVDDKIKTTATWAGMPGQTFHIPATKRHPAMEIDAIDMASFLGWYVSEGCCGITLRNGSPSTYRVSISQLNGDKKKEIVSLCERLPWSFHETASGVVFSNQQLHDVVAGLGDVYSKRAPQWIKDATPAVVSSFIKSAVSGDGWRDRKHEAYATVSRGLADDMQELYLKCGFGVSMTVRQGKPYTIRGRSGTNVVPQYHVHRKTRKCAWLMNHEREPNFRQIDYDGYVYCASVPNGTLIVRRNGKVAVCGNCFVGCAMAASMLGCGLAGEVVVGKKPEPFRMPARR